MSEPILRDEFEHDGSSRAVLSSLFDAPVPANEGFLARSRRENFPVAMRWLPRSMRDDLMALYAYARLVDDIGDEVDGDRMAMLDELSLDLEYIETLEPRHPVMRRLRPVVERRGLGIAVLERLIEANRRDQSLRQIATWEELVESCELSAHPVGELVLQFLGASTEETVALSNSICTALQVVEHCQDVSEDCARGRVYLPAKDLERARCASADLTRAPASPELRKVVRLQVERCRVLLADSDMLLSSLSGVGVPLVAGYAAGAMAVCDALERADFDVNSEPVNPRKHDLIRRWLGLLWRAGVRL